MKSLNKLIKGEEILIKIKKKSDISFWDYQIMGLLSFFTNNSMDYYIMTNNRILLSIKNNDIINIEYNDFSKVQFNSSNDRLIYLNKNNERQNLSLKKLRLTYEEIQLLKNKLNA